MIRIIFWTPPTRSSSMERPRVTAFSLEEFPASYPYHQIEFTGHVIFCLYCRTLEKRRKNVLLLKVTLFERKPNAHSFL